MLIKLINKLKKFESIVGVLFVLTVFLLSYYKVPFIFFQQDDMFDFGLFISEGWGVILRGLGDSEVRHFVPLSRIISYTIYQIFGLRYWIYNIMGLIFHFTNGILVYLLARRMFKRRLSAVISILVLLSSSVAAEFIMWPIISLNSISLSFSLVSWLLIADEKIFPKIQGLSRGVVISSLFLLAMFFVEYSAGLILFIPLAVILISSGGFKKKLNLLTPFTLVVIGYLLLRLIPSFLNQGSAATSLISHNTTSSFFLGALGLVVRYFGQMFLGQPAIFFLSNTVVNTAINRALSLKVDSISTENIIFPVVAGTVGFLLIGVSILFYRKLKNANTGFLYSKNFLLCVAFIIFSSFPYFLNSGSVGLFPIISSRYMYFGLAGMALCFGFASEIFFKSRNKAISGRLFFFITILFICYGTWGNIRKANHLYSTGAIRLKIINFVEKHYSSLPPKVVFYTESDKSYYGLPDHEKILPFQSGFGQTLLIFLTQKEKLPKEFYPGRYLWGIDAQGYKEFEERGFGYFRDFNKLVKTIENEKLPPESIFSFRYDSESQIPIDNTDEVRGRLESYFSDKKEINPKRIDIYASVNLEKVTLMLDGKRNTFWDSKLPYALPHFIQVGLDKSKEISLISIDSYNNKDQNEIGYAVYLSNDGKIWEKVFYSKNYPPGEDGVANIYLLPKYASFVKIQQIGYHEYAPWVIHELKIYEVKN